MSYSPKLVYSLCQMIIFFLISGMIFCCFYFFKYILLIMLLRLFHILLPFIPLCPTPPSTLHPPTHQHSPHPSSCPWVIHISSLASPFPILFLTPPCLFCPTSYAAYSLYLFPHPLAPLSLMLSFHMISTSMILFLF